MSKTIKTQKEMIGGAIVISFEVGGRRLYEGIDYDTTAGSHIRDGGRVRADQIDDRVGTAGNEAMSVVREGDQPANQPSQRPLIGSER